MPATTRASTCCPTCSPRCGFGDLADPGVVMGPLVSAALRDRLLAAIRGAEHVDGRIVTGDGVPADQPHGWSWSRPWSPTCRRTHTSRRPKWSGPRCACCLRRRPRGGHRQPGAVRVGGGGHFGLGRAGNGGRGPAACGCGRYHRRAATRIGCAVRHLLRRHRAQRGRSGTQRLPRGQSAGGARLDHVSRGFDDPLDMWWDGAVAGSFGVSLRSCRC
jgi:hypothetical protein